VPGNPKSGVILLLPESWNRMPGRANAGKPRVSKINGQSIVSAMVEPGKEMPAATDNAALVVPFVAETADQIAALAAFFALLDDWDRSANMNNSHEAQRTSHSKGGHTLATDDTASSHDQT